MVFSPSRTQTPMVGQFFFSFLLKMTGCTYGDQSISCLACPHHLGYQLAA